MELSSELRLPIKGYEDRYEITSTGKVWSIRSQKFLAPIKGSKGRSWYVNLTSEGSKQTVFYIHRLVGMHFLTKDNEYQTDIDHKDGNPLNNDISNLRWATHSENMRNTKVRKEEGKTSKYKGVCWSKDKQKWRITIACKHIGYSDNEDDAAKIYNEYIINNWGKFANPNIIKLPREETSQN